MKYWLALFLTFTGISNTFGGNLPREFVYLRDIDPSIQQDIRYAGFHNFIGRPLKGYFTAECILTRPAALALAALQKELLQSGLSLKVYDCYRPQQAVNDIMAWSKIPGQQSMKAEFYPRVSKTDFFRLGYVMEQSGHTRGSTVDLTIAHATPMQEAAYHSGQPLTACFAPYLKRYGDNTIDMGTGYDCFDVTAHFNYFPVGTVAYAHRFLLRTMMEKHGFSPYKFEWWHFTLKNEPYPDTYFNFPITKYEIKCLPTHQDCSN